MNSEQLKDLVVEALEDVKAKDVVELDVRDMTTVTDYMTCAIADSLNFAVEQLRELVTRFQLDTEGRLFTRCSRCNANCKACRARISASVSCSRCSSRLSSVSSRKTPTNTGSPAPGL